MALSGTYAFTANVNRIVASAMRKVGALATGQVATGQELNDGIEMLNEIVLSWQEFNIFLWTVEEYTAATVIAQDYIDIDSKVLYVTKAFIRISSDDHPIALKTYDQFQNITDKSSAGRPTVAAVDSQHENPMKMRLYDVPEQVYDLHYMGVRRLQDFKTGKGADFPVGWIRPLIFALAADMGYDYGVPSQEIILLENKAKGLRDQALTGNRELTGPEYIEGAYESWDENF